MGNKKLKDDVFTKLSQKLTEVWNELSPATGKKAKKSIENSAKKLSGKLVKQLKKVTKEENTPSATKTRKKRVTKAPKVASAATPKKPRAKKA